MRRVLLPLGAFAALTVPAAAHTSVAGADPMVNGALHPLVTPAHALVLVALGLLLAQRLPHDLRTPGRSLAPAAAVALGVAALLPGLEIPPPVLLGLALLLGLLVALDRALPRLALAGLAVAAGLGVGLDSGLPGAAPWPLAKTLIGTWLAIQGVVLYLALSAANAHRWPWARTALRVVGSWIVAISLMVLAFSLRAPSSATGADDQPGREQRGEREPAESEPAGDAVGVGAPRPVR